ncbi:MAG: 3-dehydroquinate synthase [Muribaculaceae bacterium]|nr:3-dehydroquinate synthase [Muribaculaceae bacterium]
MADSAVFFGDIEPELQRIIACLGPSKVFVITDDNTRRLCLPLLRMPTEAVVLSTPPGDENKTLDAAASLWRRLGDNGATRSSLTLCLGGGMVTDLGGFVASTYMRGMPYVNVPTTLLGAVDAATGGKTGINFDGMKNMVGVFASPVATLVSTRFLGTLPRHELLSGYAEMLKHALLSSPEALDAILEFDPTVEPTSQRMLKLLQENIAVKQRIVAADPTEHGIRKSLNLGHTAGHALEALAMERGNSEGHGFAVARGLVVELVLSHFAERMPSSVLYRVADFVRRTYGPGHISCDDYPRLLTLMSHDKKNSSPDAINFTLLSAPGNVHINRTIPQEEIAAALDVYRDLMGI